MSARPAASLKLVVHELSASALRVLAVRYIRRDATGQVAEAAAKLFLRWARAVAHAELILRPGERRIGDRRSSRRCPHPFRPGSTISDNRGVIDAMMWMRRIVSSDKPIVAGVG